MSDISSRLFKIGKAYLDAARSRIDEIDRDAQSELSRIYPNSDPSARGLPRPGPDDPFDRAEAKITNTHSVSGTQHSVLTSADSSAASPVDVAFRTIGVSPGSDYATVEAAVVKLRRRCSPSAFPAGSIEQSQAADILDKVESSLSIIQTHYNLAAQNRFDKLEF